MGKKKQKTIQVLSRFRPPITDWERAQRICVKFERGNTVLVEDVKAGRVLRFAFDGIFPPETTQKQVYDIVAASLLDDVFEGFNSSIITYGQTGTGKTYTMEGPGFQLAEVDEAKQDELAGIVPRLINDIFARVDVLREEGKGCEVHASFVEVYKDNLVDCLKGGKAGPRMALKSPRRGKKKQMATLDGHTRVAVLSKEDLTNVYRSGVQHRVVQATNANPVSSRGHGVFDIHITITAGITSTHTSLFRLVDLAGSEQAENTGDDAARKAEAKFINTSLTALGTVVTALAQQEKLVNYRMSLLTRVLEESLGANSKTLLLVTGKPIEPSCKSTLNSLRFAAVATTVRGAFQQNVTVTKKQLKMGLAEKDALLQERNREISVLREEKKDWNLARFEAQSQSPSRRGTQTRDRSYSDGHDGFQLEASDSEGLSPFPAAFLRSESPSATLSNAPQSPSPISPSPSPDGPEPREEEEEMESEEDQWIEPCCSCRRLLLFVWAWMGGVAPVFALFSCAAALAVSHPLMTAGGYVATTVFVSYGLGFLLTVMAPERDNPNFWGKCSSWGWFLVKGVYKVLDGFARAWAVRGCIEAVYMQTWRLEVYGNMSLSYAACFVLGVVYMGLWLWRRVAHAAHTGDVTVAQLTRLEAQRNREVAKMHGTAGEWMSGVSEEGIQAVALVQAMHCGSSRIAPAVSEGGYQVTANGENGVGMQVFVDRSETEQAQDEARAAAEDRERWVQDGQTAGDDEADDFSKGQSAMGKREACRGQACLGVLFVWLSFFQFADGFSRTWAQVSLLDVVFRVIDRSSVAQTSDTATATGLPGLLGHVALFTWLAVGLSALGGVETASAPWRRRQAVQSVSRHLSVVRSKSSARMAFSITRDKQRGKFSLLNSDSLLHSSSPNPARRVSFDSPLPTSAQLDTGSDVVYHGLDATI